MIGFLRGEYAGAKNDVAVIDVGGVGYEITMGVTDIAGLEELIGQEVKIFSDTVMREDSLKLYGFTTESAKHLFRILCGISGVGPKIALAILDQLGSKSIISASMCGDYKAFQSVSGVGEKSARKLVLEMESKISKLPDLGIANDSDSATGDSTTAGNKNPGMIEDLISALVNLGYPKNKVLKAIKSSWIQGSDFETMLRLVTKKLSES